MKALSIHPYPATCIAAGEKQELFVQVIGCAVEVRSKA